MAKGEFKRLLELKAPEMLDRTIEFSRARYDRRLKYKAKVKHKVGPQDLMESGNFSVLLEVGSYAVILEFKDMKSKIDKYKKGYKFTIQTCKNLINSGLGDLDLAVFCTCDDFRYRFHYVATLEDSIPEGAPTQKIPAKIRNPENEGFLCKHLVACITSPSSWIPKAASLLRDSIKFYQSKTAEAIMKGV